MQVLLTEQSEARYCRKERVPWLRRGSLGDGFALEVKIVWSEISLQAIRFAVTDCNTHTEDHKAKVRSDPINW